MPEDNFPRGGGSQTLDEVSFFDDFEKAWYSFEWWRKLMESNRPVEGLCASNRDWKHGVE
jgi:hypothetical protein